MEALRGRAGQPHGAPLLGQLPGGPRPGLAVAEYRKAIELEFDFPDAHLNLALALADRGQLEEAVLELETAHGQAPEDEMVQHELASCLIDLERYPEAIGHLKKIVKNHPEHVEAYVDLGIAYTAQGFYAEAEAVLQKALEIDAHDFASHYHLAALYATWGRPARPSTIWKRLRPRIKRRPASGCGMIGLFETLRSEERYVKLMA